MLSITFLLIWTFILAIAGYLTIGYPILIIGFAAIKPSRTTAEPIFPSVSLVIPCFNEAEVIREKLQAVLELEYPREKLEIIVADDGSEDTTAEIADEFAPRGVKVLRFAQRRGKVAVMNETAQHLTSEIVVFTDADVFCPPESLKLIVRHFADHSVGCVTAGHRIQADGSHAGKANDLYWRYESLLKSAESHIYTTVAASGHMLAVRHSLIEPLPKDTIVDDFYRALTVLRRGYRVIYEPRAECIQRPVTSMIDEVARRKRINAGRFQVLRAINEFLPDLSPAARLQVISHKLARPFLPILMMLAFLLNPIPIFLPGWERLPEVIRIFTIIMLISQVAFYLMAVAGYISDKLGWKPRLLSLPYYLVSANVGALLGLAAFLRGRQTVLWDQARRS